MERCLCRSVVVFSYVNFSLANENRDNVAQSIVKSFIRYNGVCYQLCILRVRSEENCYS
jgi:hypothetical protein